MKNPIAQELGRMAKGKKKKLSKEERQRRADAMREIQKIRFERRKDENA